MERKNLNIKVSANVYHMLKSDIGSGRISDFVEGLIVKELGTSEKRTEQEYRECYSNPRMIKEAKQWEQAEIESWRNFEKNKKRQKNKWLKS